jgi:hypothetical protein
MRIVERRSNYIVMELVDGLRILYSYNTPVAAYQEGVGFIKTDRHFSRTTSGHINRFLDGAQARVVPHSEFEGIAGEGRY